MDDQGLRWDLLEQGTSSWGSVEVQKPAQLHHHAAAHVVRGSHPTPSIPSLQTQSLQPKSTSISDLQQPPAGVPQPLIAGIGKLFWGEDFIHSQLLVLRGWKSSAPPADQPLFAPPLRHFSQPKALPAGGGRGLDPSPAPHLHKQDEV